jgi:methylenetetrahydrofolate dehydrogenase (NADP+)/methenyltetrahydrofolate cyclohydrolase
MQIIDGKLVAKYTREILKTEVDSIRAERGDEIGLAVVLVGEFAPSKIYVRNKVNACSEVGIVSTLVKLEDTVTEEEILAVIKKLNEDDKINGLMVQLPLPKHLNESRILNAINPDKDVDGCHYAQKGKLFIGKPELIACTPFGVIKMLEYYNIPIAGKHAVVVGRSNLVGKPLAQLLLDKNATVTMCHSKTEDLQSYTKSADILCVAIGKPKSITSDMVKNGAVVIDVGISSVDGKCTGDIDFENVKEKCSFITPVPGGVGPMTVTMLLSNTVKAYKYQNNLIK